MNFNVNVLRGLIRERVGSESKLASLLGMNKSTLSSKLNGRSQFTYKDIRLMIKYLTLNVHETMTIFFPQ